MQVWQALTLVVRWPNLVFIALSQSLSWYFLVRPALASSPLFPWHQCLFVLSTILIAAAGYMINDYFDWQIDTINKPQRVVIGKIIPRRTIILWHVGLNVAALILAFWAISSKYSPRLLIWPCGSILLLWFYSTTFKRKLIIGNVVVALMTALTVALPAIIEFNKQWMLFPTGLRYRWFAYVLFAFLVTIIREIVKDIEDIKGDSSQACQTMPLVWGINKARYVVDGVWGLLLFGLMAMLIWTPSHETIQQLGYGILLIPIPFLMMYMHKAKTSHEFKQVSRAIKGYTLLGILTMMG